MEMPSPDFSRQGSAPARTRARCWPWPTSPASTPTASPPTRARAGATARWPTPTSRAACSRSSPPPPRCRRRWWSPTRSSTAATARSRSRAPRINDHGVFDQLTFRDVIAKSSDIGVVRVAQRAGPRELQPLRARLRLRRADRRGPARRGARPAAPDRAVERALAADHVLRPGDRRDRAADGAAVGRGGQRRLPDAAPRRAPGGGRATGAWCRRRSPRPCAACSSPRPSTRSPRCWRAW